jgi:hypothetical protein
MPADHALQPAGQVNFIDVVKFTYFNSKGLMLIATFFFLFSLLGSPLFSRAVILTGYRIPVYSMSSDCRWRFCSPGFHI